ncbi:MAG TPA: efflux RND transporter periplasmic adaptor subunit [Paludibacter sp.]|nr:efflux RND transporter periplasmic adaptor subunit [Paludibacter sp.]
MRKCKATNVLNLCLFVLVTVLPVACKKEKVQEVPLGKVTQGTFYIDIYEEGEIEAIRSTNASSPSISWRYGNLKITQIVKDGKEVQAGDTLIVFDPSEVKKGVTEAESRLQMSEAELIKLEAQQSSDLEDLKADYEVARISQDISKIKFESAGYEANIKKKEIQLNLEKANIALDRAKEQIDNRIKIQREEVKQKRLSMDQDKAQLTEANETLKKLYVISPASGIAIVSKNWSTGNKYQVGEQCWPGMPLIQLPDLSALKATVKVNEVDISKITKGLKVEIKPDAFSSSKFTGTVTSVANLAVNKDNKSKVKVFPVEININETNDKLLPGLTVSCRVIVGTIKNAMYVPLDAVHSEGDVSYVYKKTAKGFEKTIVKTGVSNADFIVVTKGLVMSDKLAMADPFKKEDKTKDKTAKAKQL